jgi:hypothetical protein
MATEPVGHTEIKVDTINEQTATNGVTVDSVIIKDSTVTLPDATAPGTPTTGFVLYSDTSDGVLKTKSDGGTVSKLVSEGWTSWSPTFDGANGLTLSGTPTVSEGAYRVSDSLDGDPICHFYILASVTTSVAGGSLKMTLPVATSIPDETFIGSGHRRSGGWTTRDLLICHKQSTEIFCEAEAGDTWAASTTYSTVSITGHYRVS